MLIRLFLQGVLSFLALGRCNASIGWTNAGCAGLEFQGYTMDQLWDNAAAMAQNAQSKATNVKNYAVIPPRTNTANIANNAKFLWNISFRFGIGGVTSSSKSTLSSVASVYSQVAAYLDPNTDAGYFFCTGSPLMWGPVGNHASGVWYWQDPGTGDRIVWLATALQGQDKRPCTPATDIVLPNGKTAFIAGTTFAGKLYLPGQTESDTVVRCIMFCVNRFNASTKPVLPQGYAVSGTFPNPDDYSSAAGTILHEMVHAVDMGTYTDQVYNDEGAYGYSRAVGLAQDFPNLALKNPDNYKIFAEMSMSPATKWGAPKPPGATRRGLEDVLKVPAHL